MTIRAAYSTEKSSSILSFCIVMFLVSSSTSFALLNNKKNKVTGDVPNVLELAPTIFGTQLEYKVAFGNKENPFQMQGIYVELSNVCGQRSQKAYSSGIYETKPLTSTTGDDDDDNGQDQQQGEQQQGPYFINDKGIQKVQLDNGGWELRWPQSSPFGMLVCSFGVPKSYQRNDMGATLEAGRFFMHHRVWTKSTLAQERQKRLKIQGEAAQSLKERDEEVKKLTDTTQEGTNAFTRMMNYGKAAKSMNDFRTSGLQEARYTPLYDDQVLVLDDLEECILSTRGLIYYGIERAGMGIKKKELEYAGESRVDFLKTYNMKSNSTDITTKKAE